MSELYTLFNKEKLDPNKKTVFAFLLDVSLKKQVYAVTGSGPRGLIGNVASRASGWLKDKGWTGTAGAVQYASDLFTGNATKAGASVALKTLKDIQFANPQLAAKLDIANVNLHEIPPDKLIAQIRYAFTLPSLTPKEKGMLAAGMRANGIRLNQKTLNFAYDTVGNYAGKNQDQILEEMFTGRFKGSPQDPGVISNYQKNLAAEARANLKIGRASCRERV